jgi:hypothetical protein
LFVCCFIGIFFGTFELGARACLKEHFQHFQLRAEMEENQQMAAAAAMPTPVECSAIDGIRLAGASADEDTAKHAEPRQKQTARKSGGVKTQGKDRRGGARPSEAFKGATAMSEEPEPAVVARPARPGANLQELAAGAFVDAGGTVQEARAAKFPEHIAEVISNAKLRFPTGSYVRFHGLKAANSLNGRTGTVTGFVEKSSRFVVQKDVAHADEARSVNVKGANLDLLPPRSLELGQLQTMIDAAPAGATVSFPRGEVDCTGGGVLEIKVAITLDGSGAESSVLKCPVVVDKHLTGDRLQLSRFAVIGHPVRIAGAKLKRVQLLQIRIDAPQHGSEDALVLGNIGGGRILVKDSNITGGADGVMIEAYGVTLKGCRIVGAASRGVFATPDFVVEDCTIMGHGAYGMKTRSGCTRLGDNRIQAGPWDEHEEDGGWGLTHGL